MRILHLTPGTGGTFYCPNCVRDGLLVRALRRRGHDVMIVPLYLPVSIDAEGLADDAPVFFGGVNVYLQQQFSFFRKTPRWLDRIFDSAWALRRAAAKEGSTSAAELGPMTYSMLRGRDGRQRKELDRLLAWLKDQPRPEVIHLSNALLLGVAPEIQETLNAPVVCTLQDEDTWIDAMEPRWKQRCWDLLAEKARGVHAFVSVSHWYAGQMSSRTGIPRDRIAVVPLGIEPEGSDPASLACDPPVLGYLSRISEAQGFGRLVEAFITLRQDPQLHNLRLRATGGVTAGDRTFVSAMRRKLAQAGAGGDVEIIENFGKAARRKFLHSITALSVPSSCGEAFGLFILEAGGCGVPVVQPDVGAFREVIDMTGGGLTYDPTDENALPETLKRVLLNPEYARSLGAAAHASVLSRFTSDAMAEKMMSVYERVVAT